MAKQTINLGSNPNDGTGDPLRDGGTKINENFDEVYNAISDIIVRVKQASDFGTIDSSKVYIIDGIIDMGNTTLEIPSGGITIQGYDFNVSKLISSENSYTMIVNAVGGSGDLLIQNMSFEVTGTSSKVFGVTSNTGNEAIEINRVNFNNCTSLGTFDSYRQVLETGTGRFGGTPEIELVGNMSGYRTSTAIALGMSNFTSLFKTGLGLNFSGRFILSINCDLPATGALFDFSDSNIANDESLQVDNTRVTRLGVLDSSDTTIHPNINETNTKSLWNDNTGIPNTYKYIRSRVTTEVTTVISTINTYVPLEGTYTVDQNSHFDMPSNGEFRLLSGSGVFQVSANYVIDGNSNDEIDLRVTKSTDDGATYPEEVNHIKRIINNLAGGRDVAFFPINFIVDLNEDDRIRVEVENKSGTSNVTAELDSYLIVSQI